MGQSTNAILFWGYTWDEETRYPWMLTNEEPDDPEDDDGDGDDDVENDWESRYAALKGLPPPASEFSEETKQDYIAYWEEKRVLVLKSPCVVDTHCSDECPMPLVAIRDSHVLALRGYPEELGDDHMKVMPEWRNDLDTFCRLMGIPIPQTEPRWYLVSDWN